MSGGDDLRSLVLAWAKAVETGDRGGILARHAENILMFDFPDTVRGLEAYARTWDFFDDSRRTAVTFAPGPIDVTVGGSVGFATCEIHCDGTTAGPIDFRLTVGFEKRADEWTIIHEHHSMPVTNQAMVGPEVQPIGNKS